MSKGLRIALVCALATVGCDYIFRLDKVPDVPSRDSGVDADLVNGPWKFVSAGDGATCAIADDDSLYCWGYNADGLLGIGDNVSRTVPTLVPGAKWREVSVGFQNACGLQLDGKAYCWGENTDGELGDGTLDNSNAPVAVFGDHIFATLDVGDDSTCAIRESDRALLCWGDNDVGQLGDATRVNRIVPTLAVGGHAWQAISVGISHTCGITMAGAAYCWGANYSGEHGTGIPGLSDTPRLVAGNHVWSQIAAGEEVSCGVTGGYAYCWGDNSTGGLGNSSASNRDEPYPVLTNIADWVEVIPSNTHTCGRQSTNAMWCWGDAPPSGLPDLSVVPQQITEVDTVASMALGTTHTCRRSPGNALACVGDGSSGQLGNKVGTMVAPDGVAHPDGGTWASVEAGRANACALDNQGALYCWGRNSNGGVGDNTHEKRLRPVRVGSAVGWSELSVGEFHACARDSGGNLNCWGSNPGGSIGSASMYSSPVPIQIASDLQLSSVGRHTCALPKTPSAAAECWGSNNYGQVGIGAPGDVATPTPVSSAPSFKAISVSYDHTCALDAADGDAYCWGLNSRGQVGTGATGGNVLSPTPVMNAMAYDRIFVGHWRSCGITPGNVTQCWGQNHHNSLGVASTATPMAIHDADQWAELTMGDEFTCGLRLNKTLRCWGRNQHGQLGDGTQMNRPMPVMVGTDSYSSISAGGHFMCGVRDGGTLFCWGSNRDGGLGTGYGWTTTWTVPEAPLP